MESTTTQAAATAPAAAPPSDVLLRTADLRHVYATEEVETTALGGVSVDVKRGEFAAIMGPSGCGKSTLLNILGLLERPTGGEYFFNGTPTAALNERKRAALRRG
ncbi:MAG TPA: ATP-binding cassette domain-containing protein, partial [Rhodothermales bacterium]|nr:ATP-binding cassette domain-containing protein [Rhodothermales bacterium]